MATITVYRGFPTTPTHVWSPFTIKLEARLRFAGLSYTIEQGSPKTGPRGKIPYIGIRSTNAISDVELHSDTQLISDLLKENGLVPDLNEALSPAENAIDLALTALLEDKLYFYNVRYFLRRVEQD
jgi:Glutathione S-transferase N-terminal domain